MVAQGHSIDEYLETIYFLAFPIGEYRPQTTGTPTLSARVAEMLGVSRASAGEMLKRLEGEGLVERGEHKEALLTATGRDALSKVHGGPDLVVAARHQHHVPGDVLHWYRGAERGVLICGQAELVQAQIAWRV